MNPEVGKKKAEESDRGDAMKITKGRKRRLDSTRLTFGVYTEDGRKIVLQLQVVRFRKRIEPWVEEEDSRDGELGKGGRRRIRDDVKSCRSAETDPRREGEKMDQTSRKGRCYFA